MQNRLWINIGLPLIALSVICFVASAIAELIPAEHFFRDSGIKSVKIAPDGKCIAYLRPEKGNYVLAIMDLNNPDSLRGFGGGLQTDILRFFWLNNEDIVFSASEERYWARGLHTVNIRTRMQNLLSEYTHSIFDTLPGDPKRFLIKYYDRSDLYPTISRVSIKHGNPATYFSNPGSAIRFFDDYDEVIRLLLCFENNENYYMYREDKRAPWRIVEFPEETTPLEFDYSGNYLYVASSLNTETTGIYLFDIEKWELGERVIYHPKYDIVSPYVINSSTSWQGLHSGHKYKGLIGVSFETQIPQKVWLNDDFKTIQKLVDDTLSTTINRIYSLDDNFKRFIIFSFSDREPGAYYLLSLDTGKIDIVGKINDSIDPEKMAFRIPISYETRDGAIVEGYLTRPRDMAKDKAGPLVMLVHGGPWARDSFGFDREAQFLANRGYSVLQVNYRGSLGYGKKYLDGAALKMGTMMQNDVTDGARWAIKKGLADPNHIAIMGWSFGGYSTVHGLVNNADLYSCGIALSGVYDWVAQMKKVKSKYGWDSYYYVTNIYGDPKIDPEFLKSISLIDKVESIEDPLLIVHGGRDMVVDDRQSRKLARAMRSAGKKVKTLYEERERHGFQQAKNRIALYEQIETFLKENI